MVVTWMLFHEFHNNWGLVTHVCICELSNQRCGWWLFCAQPLPEPVPTYRLLDTMVHIPKKFYYKYTHFHARKFIWNCHMQMSAILLRPQWLTHVWPILTGNVAEKKLSRRQRRNVHSLYKPFLTDQISLTRSSRIHRYLIAVKLQM